MFATVSQFLLTGTGYYVRPRDGSHFVRLFADAQFYSRESSITFAVPRSLTLTSRSSEADITTL